MSNLDFLNDDNTTADNTTTAVPAPATNGSNQPEDALKALERKLSSSAGSVMKGEAARIDFLSDAVQGWLDKTIPGETAARASEWCWAIWNKRRAQVMNASERPIKAERTSELVQVFKASHFRNDIVRAVADALWRLRGLAAEDDKSKDKVNTYMSIVNVARELIKRNKASSHQVTMTDEEIEAFLSADKPKVEKSLDEKRAALVKQIEKLSELDSEHTEQYTAAVKAINKITALLAMSEAQKMLEAAE
jgi:hypothetical protein